MLGVEDDDEASKLMKKWIKMTHSKAKEGMGEISRSSYLLTNSQQEVKRGSTVLVI